jgi:hypothetical protein
MQDYANLARQGDLCSFCRRLGGLDNRREAIGSPNCAVAQLSSLERRALEAIKLHLS